MAARRARIDKKNNPRHDIVFGVGEMTARTVARPATLVLTILLALDMLAVAPIHATTTSWTVSIDADSTGPTDANIQSSHNILGLTTITIGAVVNASSAQPITNVRGWQFAIVYDNTTLTPAQIQYGAQPGPGNPNWAFLAASAGSGFGGHSITHVNATACSCDPATHAEIIVYFTIVGTTSPVNIAPALSPTVQGNLLASVSFTVTDPSIVGAKFSPTDIIFVDGNGASMPGINAGPSIVDFAAWTVKLDADSTGQNDADIQTVNTVRNSTTIGALIDASNNYPLNNVTGWQFSIAYDSTSLSPRVVAYGAQTGSGHPDWAGLIQAGNARSYNNTLSIDSTHKKILVNFTLINPNPPLTISPYLYPTIQGNLLANINFTVLNTASSPLTLSVGDVVFYDNSTMRKPISDIVAGSPIAETIGTPSPPPLTPTNTVYILLGIAAGIAAGIAILVVLRRRRRGAPASSNKNLKRPVRAL